MASIYLHTRVGASAPCNLDLLEAVAAVLRSLQGPWILGGDFNATPAELAATGFLKLAGDVVIKAPGEATAGKREIDFFIFSPGLVHAAAAAHVQQRVPRVRSLPGKRYCDYRVHKRKAWPEFVLFQYLFW